VLPPLLAALPLLFQSPCTTGVGCQLPDQEEHGAGGTVVSSDRSSGTRAADTFTPTVDGSVSAVCFWGVYVDGFSDCAPGPGDAFQVTYYRNDAGGAVPGAVIAGPRPLALVGAQPTGALVPIVAQHAEYRYEASHAPVALTAGDCVWIEISNDLPGSCEWAWSKAPPGDGVAAWDDGGPAGYAGTTDDLAFCLDLPMVGNGCAGPPPANDTCATPQPVAGAGLFPFDLTAATSGGPNVTCGFAPGIDRDVWFLLTAACAGTVRARTCGQTAVDTKIVVYDGAACPPGAPLACNDDNCGVQSSVSWAASTGATYLIRLGSFPSSLPGTGSLEIAYVAPGPPPTAYCTAGTSASGCIASISSNGVPSASAGIGFDVFAWSVEGQKDGMFFYGTNGRQAVPWGNGTSLQCVVPPVRRAGLLQGRGSPGTCDGWFTQDLNARWAQKPTHNPGAAAVVGLQLWYRDPQNTSNQTTSLSSAIEVTVCP